MADILAPWIAMLVAAAWLGALLAGMSFFAHAMKGRPTPERAWRPGIVRIVLALAIAGTGLIVADDRALGGAHQVAIAVAGIAISVGVEILWRTWARRRAEQDTSEGSNDPRNPPARIP